MGVFKKQEKQSITKSTSCMGRLVKILLGVLVFVLVISQCAANDNDSTESTVEETTIVESVESEVEVEAEVEAPKEETVNEEILTFELIAGEAGEYGELFTINKDTEFEETYYIYHIPSGAYTITNTGEYMSQLNVYSDEIVVNEAGWEEPAETFYVKLLDVGQSDTVTVADGSFIEIHEPASFTFESVD